MTINYQKNNLRLSLVYRDVIVEAHDAKIGARCCRLDLQMDETRCPKCGLDITPIDGQVIALDGTDYLIRRQMTDDDIRKWVKRRVDLIIDGPNKKDSDGESDKPQTPHDAKPPRVDPPKKDEDPPPPPPPKKRPLDESTKQIAGKMNELGWPGKASEIYEAVKKKHRNNKTN